MIHGKRYVLCVVFVLLLAVGITIPSQLPAQTVPDLSIWVGTWFKVNGTDIRYEYSDIGVKPVPPYLTEKHNYPFVRITSWDPDTKILTMNAYMQDDFGNWNPTPVLVFEVNYFAGNQLNFTGWYHMVLASGSVYSGMFVFKGKLNRQDQFIYRGKTFVKTLGAYQGWIEDAPGTERQAARIKDLMVMVPESKVPDELLVP